MKEKTLFTDILGAVSGYFKWIVLIIVLCIALSGIQTVETGEVAVILRFGELVGDTPEEQIHEPGILFALPYIIDEVITVPTGRVFDLTVDRHFTNGEMSSVVTNNGYIMTGDSNIAMLRGSVKYTITDPVAYALYNADVAKTLDGIVSSAMTVGASSQRIDSLLTDGKEDFANDIIARSQSTSDRLGLGITITSLELTTLTTPVEVRDIFELVNSTSVEAATKLRLAEQYRENLLPKAQSDAAKLISEANSLRASRVAEANSSLTEFYGVLAEYEASPDVVYTRLYTTKLAAILGKIGRIHVVSEGGTVVIN